MGHPSVEQLLEGEPASLGHAARCASCKKLATLVGCALPDLPPDDDLTQLPPIDDALYADWTELEEARGGMGRIARARDRRLGRVVAIKRLRQVDDAAERAALRHRFEREARLTARLQHPAIVGVYEAGRFGDGEPFYAMPLLRGAPLGDELARRPALADRIALLPHLTTVADAVAYAHAQGIVHRDLKPDNILIGTFGETVLIDWGLAKDVTAPRGDAAGPYRAPEAEDDGGLTVLGVGTPAYMPPEQARGHEPDPRVDVYALGATLYHLLAGAPPYAGRDDARRALADGPPAPLDDDVPRELADIVARAMARDPAARYQTAQELADELRRFQTGQLLQSRRYGLGELVRHWMRRHRTALRVAAVAVIALVALAVVAVVRIARERDRARANQDRAERELRRAQGVVASRLAADPTRRLDAIVLGVQAIGPEVIAGQPPAPESLAGLLDALTAGPAVVPLEHEGLIKGVAFAGDRVVGVDDSRAVMVWDLASGRTIARHPSQLPSPEHVVVSPDGATAVVFGFDPVVEVLTLATGVTRPIDTTTNAVAGFLADGRLVLAATELTVRDPVTLAVVEREPLPAATAHLAIGESDALAVSTIDGSLWLRRPGKPAEVRPAGTTGWLTFEPDDRTLIQTGLDRVVRRWTVTAPGSPATVLLDDPTMLLGRSDVSDDGQFVAINRFDEDGARATRVLGRHVGSRDLDGMVHQWLADSDRALVAGFGPVDVVDATHGRSILRLIAHHDEVGAFGHGDRVVTADRSGPAFVWDVSSGRAAGRLLGHGAEVMTIVRSPDDARVLTASLDGTARVWSLDDGTELGTFEPGAEVLAAAWKGPNVITAGLDGAVYRFDPDGEPIGEVHGDGPALALAVSDHRIAIGFAGGKIVVTDAALDEPRELDAAAGAVTALAFGADDRLYSAHADGSTRAWDAGTGAETARLDDLEPIDEPDDHDGHAALHVTADGRVLAARPSGHTLVLDGADLSRRATLTGRAAGTPSPIGPDGHTLVTVVGDGGVFVHDLTTGASRRLDGHTTLVLATAFSTDGAWLATGGIDGVIEVRALATDRVLARFDGAGLGAATALTFDGGALFAGYESGAVRVHPVTPDAALDQACEVIARFGRAAEVARYCAGRTTTSST